MTWGWEEFSHGQPAWNDFADLAAWAAKIKSGFKYLPAIRSPMETHLSRQKY
jgi:hypothetical protein